MSGDILFVDEKTGLIFILDEENNYWSADTEFKGNAIEVSIDSGEKEVQHTIRDCDGLSLLHQLFEDLESVISKASQHSVKYLKETEHLREAEEEIAGRITPTELVIIGNTDYMVFFDDGGLFDDLTEGNTKAVIAFSGNIEYEIFDVEVQEVTWS